MLLHHVTGRTYNALEGITGKEVQLPNALCAEGRNHTTFYLPDHIQWWLTFSQKLEGEPVTLAESTD